MKSRGFTLVELVAVLVVLSVVGLGVASLLRLGGEAYADNRDRTQLVDKGRYLAERLSRELRNAAPNSLRLDAAGQCLEFVPIRHGLTYAGAPVAPAPAATELRVLDPNGDYLAAAGDRLIINPLRFERAPLRARDYFPASAANAGIDSISGPDGDGWRTLTLDGAHRFAAPSPGSRAYVYGPWRAYCLQGDRLLLLTGRPGAELPPSLALRQSEGWQSRVLADGLAPLAGQPLFSYDELGARVQIRLRLREHNETLELYHGVAIPNSR